MPVKQNTIAYASSDLRGIKTYPDKKQVYQF